MNAVITLSDLYEFKRCSLRYKLTKKDKLNTSLNAADGLREAVNSTINYFYYNLQDGKFITMGELKEKFSSIWYGEMDLYDIKLNGDREKRTRELEAFKMLQQMYRKEQRSESDIVAVNLDFRIPFGDFAIQDKIPLIRKTLQGYEIVNFKTGKQKYDEFWQRTDMGITLQAIAFDSMFKKIADSFCIENIRTSKTIYVERARKDYQRLYKSVKMMKTAMSQGWYYPNESFMCSSCPVKDLCMEWR
ncbi:PD-(D/E)XK nuclease family protein [Virgibacillus salexigens]|uniref:CRISPR-associated protein Cas4 n=1 Tax=Virgibacillus massiliensis TaxID=1462526 RepID=A0A024QHS5_9BACI|nr:PD-(D/E)XK nuclease family protein [Virgibacillus massiliensis]CDQ41765.1 CRISPR-associated protein Cas4 [Virgibacillus massiliensis]